MRYCTSCGVPLEGGERFCTQCGSTVVVATDPAATVRLGTLPPVLQPGATVVAPPWAAASPLARWLTPGLVGAALAVFAAAGVIGFGVVSLLT